MSVLGRIMQITEGGILDWASLNLRQMTPGTMHPQCSRIDKSPMKALTGQFRPQASPDNSQGATNLKLRTHSRCYRFFWKKFLTLLW
jgi:hypothetical protein